MTKPRGAELDAMVDLEETRAQLERSGTVDAWKRGLREPVATMAMRVVDRLLAFERELSRLHDAVPEEQVDCAGPIRIYTLADGSLLLLHADAPHRVMYTAATTMRVEAGGVWQEVTRLSDITRDMQIHAAQLVEEWKERTKRR